MSHELRTPLNAIIGFSEMMLNAAPSSFSKPEYAEYTRDIKKSGEDLLQIVNDILDLSKVEAGQANLNESPVDIPDLIQLIVQRLSVQAGTADLIVSTLFSDNLPLLLADELKLKKILINLLSNAIKFTPAGGVITITADFSLETGHILKVSDTGIGIASEDFDTVLAPFQQVDSSLSRKYDGTGLGLPLAASFVEMHAGTLKIASEEGIGIRFPPDRTIHVDTHAVDGALKPDQARNLMNTFEYDKCCIITDPRRPDNPIVYVSPEFERQTGYPKSEVLGRNCRFLQGPKSDAETVKTIRTAIENVLPVTAILNNYRKDGSLFRAHLSIRPTLNDDGELTAFIAVQSVTDANGEDIGNLSRRSGGAQKE